MAEFNDATFAGDVSGLDGTFSGTLTARAINAANNINIAGNSVARTTVSTRDISNSFDDDSVWRSVHQHTVLVPSEDTQGGWLNTAIQYSVYDRKGRENHHFPAQLRFRINGLVIYTTPNWILLGDFYKAYGDMYSEIVYRAPAPGAYTISMDLRVGDRNTNMYIEFVNIVFRTDYFRK